MLAPPIMTTLAAYALWGFGPLCVSDRRGCRGDVTERNRPAWEGSTRRERLPADWPQRRAEAHRRNPLHICHWCRDPGGSELDHKVRGDDHRQENLDWIHNRSDFLAGRSRQNCHGQKTGAEGAAARQTINRPDDVHPALR